MAKVDGRGSEPQKILYEMMKSLYKNYTVIYEQELPIGLRYDLFVSELGIAVE